MASRTVSLILAGDARKMSRTLDRAARDVERFERGASGALGRFSRNMAIAAAGVVAQSARMARDFGRSVQEVRTLVPDMSDGMFDSLVAGTREAGKQLGLLTTDTIPALYQAISAGVPPGDVLDYLDVAGRAAIAGVTDLTTSVDALTTVTNTWGKSMGVGVQQAADVLFTAVKLGKTTFGELGSSINQVAGLASTFRIEFEQVVAAVTELTKAGVPTAEAMTKVRALMQSLASPSARAAQTFRDLGIEVSSARLAEEGLLAVTQEVLTATAGNDELQRKLFGSVEALQGAFVVAAGGGAAYSDTLKQLRDATGAAGTAFETMAESDAHQLSVALAALNDAMITLGVATLPALTDAISLLSQAAVWLIDHLQVLVPFVGVALVAAVGKAVAAIKAMRTAMAAAGVAAAFGTGGLTVALALVATGISLLIVHWDKVTAALAAATGWFQRHAEKILLLFGPAGWIIVALKQMAGGWQELWDGILAVVEAVVNGILMAVETMVNGVIGTINRLASAANASIGRLPGVPDIPLIPALQLTRVELGRTADAAETNAAAIARASWKGADEARRIWLMAYDGIAEAAAATANKQIEAAAAAANAQAWSAADAGSLDTMHRVQSEVDLCGGGESICGSLDRLSTAADDLGTDLDEGVQRLVDSVQTIADWDDLTQDQALAAAREQLAALQRLADGDGQITLGEQAAIDLAQRQVDQLARVEEVTEERLSTIADWLHLTRDDALAAAQQQLAAVTALANGDGRVTLGEQEQIDIAQRQVDLLADNVEAVEQVSEVLAQGVLATIDDWSGLSLDDALRAAWEQVDGIRTLIDLDGQITVGEQQMLNEAQRQVAQLEELAGIGRDTRTLLQRQIDSLRGLDDWRHLTHGEAMRHAQGQLDRLTRIADADGRRTVNEQRLIDAAESQLDAVQRLFDDSKDRTNTAERAMVHVGTLLRWDDGEGDAPLLRHHLSSTLDRREEFGQPTGGGSIAGGLTVNLHVEGSVVAEQDLRDLTAEAVADAQRHGALTGTT